MNDLWHIGITLCSLQPIFVEQPLRYRLQLTDILESKRSKRPLMMHYVDTLDYKRKMMFSQKFMRKLRN